MASGVFFEAGRVIRPYLPELLVEEAPDFEARLLELLKASDQAETEAKLADLFQTNDATHTWVASFIETRVPPDLAGPLERSTDGGYDELKGEIVAAPQGYACPVDKLFVWYRVEVSQPVPECPDHPGHTLELMS
jgi:hypothetical protein